MLNLKYYSEKISVKHKPKVDIFTFTAVQHTAHTMTVLTSSSRKETGVFSHQNSRQLSKLTLTALYTGQAPQLHLCKLISTLIIYITWHDKPKQQQSHSPLIGSCCRETQMYRHLHSRCQTMHRCHQHTLLEHPKQNICLILLWCTIMQHNQECNKNI